MSPPAPRLPPALLVLAAALGLVVAGCTPDRLVLRAAHELECASNKLEVTTLGDGTIRIRGCGETVVFLCEPNNLSEERCHMLRRQPAQVVQEAAARDFRCTEPVSVDPVEGGNYLAIGCGRKELYRCEGSAKPRCQSIGPAPPGSHPD